MENISEYESNKCFVILICICVCVYIYMYILIALSLYLLKIPVLNIQMKLFPALCTVAGTIFSCTNYFRVIFTGGVGKNGSTIAVSIS